MRLFTMQDVLTWLAVDADFIKNISTKSDLSPLNFVTIALFSWECAPKITKIDPELLIDVDMILN